MTGYNCVSSTKETCALHVLLCCQYASPLQSQGLATPLLSEFADFGLKLGHVSCVN